MSALRRSQKPPGVTLSSPSYEDAEEFIARARESSGIYRGLASPPTTTAQFAKYVERCGAANFAGFLLRRRVDRVLVGSVAISEIARGNFRSGYLGYQIFAPFARQGYMTAGLTLLVRSAFGRMRLHRLEANIQPHNLASLKLVRRLGFQREGYSPRYLKISGRWRDHERWALLAEVWRESRAGVRRAK